MSSQLVLCCCMLAWRVQREVRYNVNRMLSSSQGYCTCSETHTYAFCKEFNSSNESRCLENGILSAWVSFIISCVEIGSPSIKRPLIGQRNEMGIATTVHMEVKHRINKRAECLMRTFFVCLFFYLRATGIFPVEDDNGSDFPLNGFFWLKLQLK